jgi:proteasome lid subunit RPN8/RPN11
MPLLKRLRSFVASRTKETASVYRPVKKLPRRWLIINEAAVLAMRDCMAPEITCGHEGIAYLFGLTNGITTLVVGAMRPQARTTAGSFNVTPVAMASVVRAASDAGLQVVGQIHTHPRLAFHSDGDVDGARIVYDGYVSIVVPEYGRLLPSLAGAAFYIYAGDAFTELKPRSVRVIGGVF